MRRRFARRASKRLRTEPLFFRRPTLACVRRFGLRVVASDGAS
ncbi:hypothetical protein BDSB_02280 [Burkholderia dolosa PC543]|nr:hypothetical protein BDSB_02280 [Burkholderia dolosa PC543]